MDAFSTAPDFILDLVFLKLNEEDLHETLRVSKSWFWASIRRTKKVTITCRSDPLMSIAEFYNNHRPPNEKIDCLDLFEHLVLDELIVIGDKQTTNYLVNNGCNTAELYIEASGEEEIPVTLASLKTITRLQSFEYCNNWKMKWHPFIMECLKSSNYEFDAKKKCPIEVIKLNYSRWNAEDSVLMSVTKLGVCEVTIDFLRTLIDHCPNLEELHCSDGVITQEWRQVFPANVKIIELHDFDVDDEVAGVVNVSTDAGRQLLPYLCQNWESVEQFHFDGDIVDSGETVYEAFPQQREEVFMCEKFNEEMNFGSSHFQSRKIHVKCNGRKALQLAIPPTKKVKLEFYVEHDFKFSPVAVCSEPEKVQRLALMLRNDDDIHSLRLPKSFPEEFTMDPLGPNSFDGFCHLTSLTLSNCSTLSIKMALDQCPSIKKLKLKELKASTISNFSVESSYANVCELVLEDCKEPIDKVFQVFPCLSAFKHSLCREDEMGETKDWLWRYLIEEDRKYGVVFENSFENWYSVSNDLQESLSQAQKLLNEYLCTESMSYLKGFKLLPRVSKQKIIYLN